MRGAHLLYQSSRLSTQTRRLPAFPTGKVKNPTFIVRFRPGITPSIMKPASPLYSLVVALVASTPLFSQQLPHGAISPRDFLADYSPITVLPASPGTRVDADLIAAACVTDDLDLAETVRCHPASRYLELRFDLSGGQLADPVMFEVYSDTVWLTNLSLVTASGTIFIRNEYMGQTITISQSGETGCSRDFVVPACTETVCPLDKTGDAVPMACDGDMVEFQFALAHDPPIDISTTDFAVYDEKNEFLTIYSLAEADSLVHLFIPVSVTERQYTLCDLFNPEGCCVKVDLPGIDCNSVPTDVVDLGELGVNVFPNPVSDQLVIDLGDGMNVDAGIAYSIISSTGQLVDAGVLTQRTTRLMTDAFPSGLFVLQLHDGQSLVGHRRFLKIQ